VHLAHVLALAEQERDGATDRRAELAGHDVEFALLPSEPRRPTKAQTLAVVGLAVAAVAGIAWWLRGRRRRAARM
jgi:hypothetical protein